MKQTLGEYLKTKRETAGLTQTDLQKALGYSSSQLLSNIERGLAYPPPNSIRTLAEKLNVTVDELGNKVVEAIVGTHATRIKTKYGV
jgi:transcriptional regulator with XRE-family HTH domain